MEPFRLLTVETILQLPNRPIALFPGLTARELPGPVRAGDRIELRRPDGTSLSAVIAGVEPAKRIDGGSEWPIVLPDSFKSSDVSPGTEVWWTSGSKL